MSGPDAMTSQEQELLTRVARAIYEARRLIEGVDSTWDEVVVRAANPDGYQYAKIAYEASIKAARAAIEAMMVPTLAMKNAGWREATAQGHDATEIEVEPIYAAMIRASLSKGEK